MNFCNNIKRGSSIRPAGKQLQKVLIFFLTGSPSGPGTNILYAVIVCLAAVLHLCLGSLSSRIMTGKTNGE